MFRALASLCFYGYFYPRFSRLGLERRARDWQPYPIDLSGQTWLVTGASGGIGAAIARIALTRGARVLAVARDPSKLAALATKLGTATRLSTRCCDCSSLRATRDLIDTVCAAGIRITVVVNNVGVLADRHRLTEEGWEASFVTNLLSHFVLTEGLYTRGCLDPEGAVINVSSGGMYGARLDLEALHRRTAQGFDGMAAYAQHKRAQVELTRAWNRRWGGAPKCYVMHPGWADTAGVQTALPWFRRVLRARLRSPEEAADTALWLGTTRPPLTTDGGIWLDRVLDPEHVFAFTRQTTLDAEALWSHLHALSGASEHAPTTA